MTFSKEIESLSKRTNKLNAEIALLEEKKKALDQKIGPKQKEVMALLKRYIECLNDLMVVGEKEVAELENLFRNS